jgi:hypothetical protein
MSWERGVIMQKEEMGNNAKKKGRRRKDKER